MNNGRTVYLSAITGVAAVVIVLLVGVPTVFAQYPGSVIWECYADGRVVSCPSSGPGGTLYFGGGTKLYSFNPDGTQRWIVDTGKTIHTTTAVTPSGDIVFGSGNRVCCYRPDGTLKWYFNADARVFSSPAIGPDGRVFFGADDGWFYAVNTNGLLDWAFRTGDRISSSPAISADGVIYFGSWDHNFYALNLDGTLKWIFSTGGYILSSPAIGIDGTIYFGSGDYRLYALNRDGTKKWSFLTGNYVYSSPVVDENGTVFFGSYDGKFYALSADGKRKWFFKSGGPVQSCPAVTEDGTVYFGSDDNVYYALDNRGKIRWVFPTKNVARSAIMLGMDGTAFFGGETNRLFAVRGHSSVANSAWPMFRGDSRHSGIVNLIIVEQPERRVKPVGERAEFSINAKSSVALDYQWFFRGSPIEGETNATLVIDSIEADDAGTYQVLVMNDMTSRASIPVTLSVIEEPVLTEQPEEDSVLPVGSSVTFEVDAESLAPLEFQWLKDGEKLEGATNAALKLSDLTVKDNGTYQALVRNVVAEVSGNKVELTVVSPPSITSQPGDKTIPVNSNVVFKVEVESITPVELQWKFEGKNIEDATSTNLLLEKVKPSDAGEYSVTAKNMADSVESKPFNLTVLELPKITKQPEDATLVLGESTVFEVAAESIAPLSYQWQFNGEDIDGATSEKLELSNVKTNDAGGYRAVVKNKLGAVPSKEAKLTVNVPPVITEQPGWYTRPAGTNVTFDIKAEGTEPLRYQWKFFGTNIASATNPELQITNISTNDAGVYSVVVTNMAGAAKSKSGVLRVKTEEGFWRGVKAWFYGVD
ncbi:MAG: immunoglobulin domain-containing protein [Verrucomicrobia bacterium]|nr:immunoglobulin domain-containing protein [Verrucomicrobiota bacterium]MCF7708544.1 immunoglobulin domain-containing protein [Verrucomicrobiota bacterium]